MNALRRSPGRALKTEKLDELRWYFEQARAHPAPSRCPDLGERFYRARDAFSAPRFKALYRVWKQDGETVFAACGSHALDEAVTAGTGRVEPWSWATAMAISPLWLLSHRWRAAGPRHHPVLGLPLLLEGVGVLPAKPDVTRRLHQPSSSPYPDGWSLK